MKQWEKRQLWPHDQSYMGLPRIHKHYRELSDALLEIEWWDTWEDALDIVQGWCEAAQYDSYRPWEGGDTANDEQRRMALELLRSFVLAKAYNELEDKYERSA